MQAAVAPACMRLKSRMSFYIPLLLYVGVGGLLGLLFVAVDWIVVGYRRCLRCWWLLLLVSLSPLLVLFQQRPTDLQR